jgi:hypothetical protein
LDGDIDLKKLDCCSGHGESSYTIVWRAYDSATEKYDISLFSQTGLLLENLLNKCGTVRNFCDHGDQITIKIRN